MYMLFDDQTKKKDWRCRSRHDFIARSLIIIIISLSVLRRKQLTNTFIRLNHIQTSIFLYISVDESIRSDIRFLSLSLSLLLSPSDSFFTESKFIRISFHLSSIIDSSSLTTSTNDQHWRTDYHIIIIDQRSRSWTYQYEITSGWSQLERKIETTTQR